MAANHCVDVITRDLSDCPLSRSWFHSHSVKWYCIPWNTGINKRCENIAQTFLRTSLKTNQTKSRQTHHSVIYQVNRGLRLWAKDLIEAKTCFVYSHKHNLSIIDQILLNCSPKQNVLVFISSKMLVYVLTRNGHGAVTKYVIFKTWLWQPCSNSSELWRLLTQIHLQK